MDIYPLLDAGAVIVFPRTSALLSLILGIYIFIHPKGKTTQFWLGRTWIVAMLGVVISSFLIFEMQLWGPLSPIHLLSLYTLWALWSGWRAARNRQRTRHAFTMVSLWMGALGLNIWFTLLPGRVLHDVVFGTP